MSCPPIRLRLKQVTQSVDATRVARDRSSVGYALAALAGVAGGASLWLAWYSFTIPQAAMAQAEAYAQQSGSLQPYIQEGLQQISRHGAFHVNAWQVMTGAPAALLVLSAIAAVMSLLALSGRASGVGRVIVWCGGIAFAIGAYHLVRTPGSSGLLQPSAGLDVSLAASLALMATGLLAHVSEAEPRHRHAAVTPVGSGRHPAHADGAWADSRSVPPPTMQ